MSEINMHKKKSKTKIMIAMLIAGAIIITGFLYRHYRNTEEPVPAMQLSVLNMSEKEVIDGQKVAAVAAIPGKTVSGTVTQRPDYVSEMEWQVLQNVARENPDVQLTDLVNKMLFIKKKQAWLDAGENTEQRRQLARQLLDMIPQQLSIEAIDAETAKEMEIKLNADLK